MKPRSPLCFLGLIAAALTTSLSAADLTLSSVSADKRLWPKEVHLTQKTAIKLISSNGAEIGSTQGQPGMAVKVIRIDPTCLWIQFGNSSATVDVAGTDLLQQSETISERIASISATPAPTAIATPTPQASATPAPSTTPAEVSSTAGKTIDFKQGWTMKEGQWKVTGDTEIAQTDPKHTCTDAYIAFPQHGKMEYRMKEKFRPGKSACNTIYIFCSDGSQRERGTAYMIVDANDNQKSEIAVVRFTENKGKNLGKFKADPVNDQWIDLAIVCDGNAGQITVTRNGKLIGTCTDPNPIKEGKDFSIGTCATLASYKEIQIRSIP